MTRNLCAMLAAVFLVLGAGERIARAEGDSHQVTTIRIGTLAPSQSIWGKVFTIWQKGFKDRTNGAAEIQFFFNGTQGDEGAMVGKIRAGQLDGAAITAAGLGQIWAQVNALELPFMKTWAKVDAARTALKPMIDTEFDKAGFKNLGDGDVGAAHLMSTGKEIHTPTDLKGQGSFVLRDDRILPVVFSTIGGMKVTPMSVPEVGSAIGGTVSVILAPPLVASQLQWTGNLRTINTEVMGFGIGSLVMSSAKFKSLPADVQTALVDTGAITGRALTKAIRDADDATYKRFAIGNPTASPVVPPTMKAYTPSPAEQAEWEKLYVQVKDKLQANGTFRADVLAKIADATK